MVGGVLFARTFNVSKLSYKKMLLLGGKKMPIVVGTQKKPHNDVWGNKYIQV